MEYRQSDTHGKFPDLESLTALPRPVYGHVLGLPNQAIGVHHQHAWVQLSYAMRGVIEVETLGGRFVAPPLHAIWIPAGVVHSVRCSADTQIRSLYIEKNAVDVRYSECKVLVVNPLIRELIRAFSELPVEYDENGKEGRLAGVLLDQLAGAQEVALSLPWPRDRRLRELCTDLQENPDGGSSLSAYGRRLRLSERSLSRLFQKETGMSFRLWRQRSRLLSSLALLERGDRVTDVALACGYGSLSAFIAAFREQMGFTPGELLAGVKESDGSPPVSGL